jgi:hypothetical protein
MASLFPCLLAFFVGTDPGPPDEPLLVWVPTCCAARTAPQTLQAYDPQPGDLVLFSDYKPIEDFIYFLVHSGGITHSAIVVARPNGTLALLEAPGLKYPVMLSDLPSRFRYYHGRIWVRRRLTPLSPGQSACLTAFACTQDGKSFSVGSLVTPLFHRPLRKPGMGCVRPDELDAPRWFCSDLVAAAGVAAGIMDPCVVWPKATDPEDLKSDKVLDLSCGWDKPARYQPCGPRPPCWWSESCCGDRAWWK